jgi:peptidoglycan/LPS O-acetylase OafA/YrhL
MPGVDGLRALAVAAVVVYHVNGGWLPGGFLGVDVFFVISGYLITSLLLSEYRKAGTINLPRFWLRRARRLLPALFLMLAATLAAMLILHPGEVARLHGAVLASVGYVTNWYFIFAHVPYFEQFGRPSVFEHLWSLAVEEQFYLIWPPVLALALMYVRRRRIVYGVAAAMAGSTALAWVLFHPNTDPSRIYYGTDTRAVGLLAGVALAFVWPASRLRPVTSRAARAALDVAGVAALAAVAAATIYLGEIDPLLYRGGMLMVALATAALLAVVAHPSSRLGQCMAAPLLVWIGVRSYGIYLWHWPVLMLTRAHQDVPFTGAPLVALQVGLTLVAATLSYRYVETPIRRSGLAGLGAAFRGDGAERRPARRAAAWSGVAALAGLGLAVALVPAATPVVPGLSSVASAAGATPISALRSSALRDPPRRATAVARRHRHAAAASHGRRSTGRVLAVGDSVMLGASSELRAAFGRNLVIDASVSRQFSQGYSEVLADERVAHASTVVVHLGTNGFVDFDELKTMLDGLRKVPRVVLVTVRVPRIWQDSVNNALAYAAKHWPNVVLADWHSVASANQGLLVDGVHPDPSGARLYAATIARAARMPSRPRHAAGRS